MAGSYDVVIVGARVAGAPLATLLAERGLEVAVVDRASFPSDVMSTHVMYPNALARLDRLGVLAELRALGPPPLYTAWHHEGRTFVAPHTAVDGRDWALCVRRVTLDDVLVRRARRAGAHVIEGFQVDGLIGAGTPGDPVRGVTGRKDGVARVLYAPLVIGADGTGSTVARLLGLPRERVLQTRTMMLYAYWRGLPARNLQQFWFAPPWIATHFPADRGHSVVVLIGPVETYSARTKDALYRRQVEAVAQLGHPLGDAEQVGGVIGTRRLDGFYRRPAGPGWVLTGDAGHFKHPAAVQGISDALAGAEVLAELIAAGDDLGEFARWRDHTTRELYAFSRFLADCPADEVMRPVMDAAIADPTFARGLVDIWSRAREPWSVLPRVPAMLAAAGATPEVALDGTLRAVPVA